ncbi:hypothetical protein OEZ85_005059 [Tetradesmus obliquus]|uniref:Senescence domain-containing protein n=1 Tax=Tetradesmus obliquus TaxID=3088 RepID=A0ABY8UK62_TETOB|nr:hypothetical protein OEZ85_005059 [Tetradesmus obliquus]
MQPPAQQGVLRFARSVADEISAAAADVAGLARNVARRGPAAAKSAAHQATASADERLNVPPVAEGVVDAAKGAAQQVQQAASEVVGKVHDLSQTADAQVHRASEDLFQPPSHDRHEDVPHHHRMHVPTPVAQRVVDAAKGAVQQVQQAASDVVDEARELSQTADAQVHRAAESLLPPSHYRHHRHHHTPRPQPRSEPTSQKLAAAWAGARYQGDLRGDAWNDTALLRQLGVPGEPQTAGQALASLYHSTAGSVVHAGSALSSVVLSPFKVLPAARHLLQKRARSHTTPASPPIAHNATAADIPGAPSIAAAIAYVEQLLPGQNLGRNHAGASAAEAPAAAAAAAAAATAPQQQQQQQQQQVQQPAKPAEHAAERVVGGAMDVVQGTTHAAAQVAGAAGGAAIGAVHVAKGAATGAVKAVAGTTTAVGHTLKAVGEGAADAVVGTADAAASAAVGAASEVASGIHQAAHTVKRAGEGAATAASDAAKGAAHAVHDTAVGAAHAVKDTTVGTAQAVQHAASATTHAVKDAAGTAASVVVGGAAGAVAAGLDKTGDVLDASADALQATADKAHSVAEDIKDAHTHAHGQQQLGSGQHVSGQRKHAHVDFPAADEHARQKVASATQQPLSAAELVAAIGGQAPGAASGEMHVDLDNVERVAHTHGVRDAAHAAQHAAAATGDAAKAAARDVAGSAKHAVGGAFHTVDEKVQHGAQHVQQGAHVVGGAVGHGAAKVGDAALGVVAGGLDKTGDVLDAGSSLLHAGAENAHDAAGYTQHHKPSASHQQLPTTTL